MTRAKRRAPAKAGGEAAPAPRRASAKERVESIGQAARTLEKLLELKRLERLAVEGGDADAAETARLREERAAAEPQLVRYLPSDDVGELVEVLQPPACDRVGEARELALGQGRVLHFHIGAASLGVVKEQVDAAVLAVLHLALRLGVAQEGLD